MNVFPHFKYNACSLFQKNNEIKKTSTKKTHLYYLP